VIEWGEKRQLLYYFAMAAWLSNGDRREKNGSHDEIEKVMLFNFIAVFQALHFCFSLGHIQ